MHRTFRTIFVIIILIAYPCLMPVQSWATVFFNPGPDQIHEIKLTIHLRGVYESKISLMTQSGGSQIIQPIITREPVKNGETVVMAVPGQYLPGEFVLRFDYKQEITSTPYPSEKSFIINQQDIELWVHPLFSNNPDSTYYQAGETENTVLAKFLAENYAQKQTLGLLQNFLMNYDDNKSEFYRQGIVEYEKRRKAHNEWIGDQVNEYRDLFAATVFRFQFVPEINWKGDQSDRKQSFKDHYFDYMDFKDTLLINFPDFKSWMDQYVNLYGEDATTDKLRDSLFTLAGYRAIEKAKTGHPKVYGWMVDYFFKGYESFNIQPGITMLAPYLDDPKCLTSKRQAILKRLEGMKTLVPGSLAPDFSFTDDSGKKVMFQSYDTGSPYKLVLFWSADCPHCTELVSKLYKWFLEPGNSQKLHVFAISLDETETELAAWEEFKPKLTGWQHILANGGVNSPEATSYFILATPVMVLVDSRTNAIVALPENADQLDKLLK
jgi:hypothetical protein